MGDGAYACMDLVTACIQQGVTLISCLRLDAQLFHFPPEQDAKKRGRKAIKGERINLKDLLKHQAQLWQTGSVHGNQCIALGL